MTADHQLFIAIACYAVAAVMLRPLLVSMFIYGASVMFGLTNISQSKSLMMGFAVSALGLSVAAWSSHADTPQQDLAGDASQTAVSKHAPKKGRTVNSRGEKKHD